MISNISLQIGSFIPIKNFSSQSGIFISSVFATSSHQAWYLRIDLSYPEAHCLTNCSCAFSCFLSVSVVPYCSSIFNTTDDIQKSDEEDCRVSIFFHTNGFGEDLVVESQVIENSKLQQFGISFKNICSRKELSQKLYNNTFNVQVIFGPADSEWLHRSRRLGYLFDNIPTAPDIIFCINGKYLYAHSEIIKHATTKFQEILGIGSNNHQQQKNCMEKNLIDNHSDKKRYEYIYISNIEFLTFRTILYYLYTNTVYVNNAPNILDLCYWANEFELIELIEVAKADFKFRLNIENVFEGLLTVGSYWEDIKDEIVIFIARNFPLIQATPGFKKAIMNLDAYPGARNIWAEITNTMKQLGYAKYLSVPLFKI
ncbi:hypothetical protein C1645_782510 [Glomus cerebriforme]|uniref:BTB domain-containing protein n=1 Tax=Glomus cerebriforme TaxID=658196 RepID=A0A397SR71_9GLOM|nr:hypothetical protein C1645_782510 [Glomus cerebriforme]